MSMQVNFSQHALRRMEERKVDVPEVYQTLLDPEREIRKGNTCLAIRRRNNKYSLIVVYVSTDIMIKVITVIVTSKLDKYLYA